MKNIVVALLTIFQFYLDQGQFDLTTLCDELDFTFKYESPLVIDNI